MSTDVKSTEIEVKSNGSNSPEPSTTKQPLVDANSVSVHGSSSAISTPPVPEQADEANSSYATLKTTFQSHKTKPIDYRIGQLRRLLECLNKHEHEFTDALFADLNKSDFESWLAEIQMIRGDIEHTIKKVKKWSQPVKTSTNLLNLPGSSYLVADPLGTVLIISPWNYPVQLCLMPLVGAIAAGNTAMIKPSELAPACSAVLARLIPQYLDPTAYIVLQGGVPTSNALLALAWDLIFFTGSTNVGKVVMTAAAKHLTPVVLELGGKSPAIVDSDVDIEVTAKRILWGKFANASQTCIAPDYVLCKKDVQSKLVESLKRNLVEFYGSDPRESKDFCRIITPNHTRRLASLLEPVDGVEPFVVETGGKDSVDVEGRYFPPTILTNVNWQHRVMSDEIFGPILPILTIQDLDEAISMVNSHPKPLAAYIFSNNQRGIDHILGSTTAGGVTVNDTLMHVTNPNLPFGGVGPSGIGSYHGKKSFEVFSHRKPVLQKKFFGDVPQRYPPYKPSTRGFFQRLMNFETFVNNFCCCCASD